MHTLQGAENRIYEACSGFNIEDSHVRIQERMANLFAIVMIAYVWYYLVGIYIHENIKEIKVLNHGRKAKSLFKYGLEYISQCLLDNRNRYQTDIFKFLSYTYKLNLRISKSSQILQSRVGSVALNIL